MTDNRILREGKYRPSLSPILWHVCVCMYILCMHVYFMYILYTLCVMKF